MKALISLYFFVLAIIQLGLLIGLFPYYKSKSTAKPNVYWLRSLIANIFALLIFGGGVLFNASVVNPEFGFTIANSLFFVAAIYQWLFCRSLLKPITPRVDRLTKILIFAFFLLFELARQYGNFEIRTSLMVILGVALFTSQFYNLGQVKKRENSPQLVLLQYATLLEASLALLRLFVLMSGEHLILQIDQLPQILIFFTIIQISINTVSYIAIGSYWSEKISLANARVSSENETIKKLLIEREELISHLSKANKTAATGALSASIAHELNQPIAAIQLNAQFFQTKLASDQLDLQSLKDIAKSIEADNSRIANIVATLRGIFKEEVLSTRSVDLSSLIDNLVPIVLPQARNQGIQLQFDLQAHQQVALNAGEFQQVLLNLVNNAIDSLSESNVSNKTILVRTKDLKDAVEISISDNGPGVPTDMISTLFELMRSHKKSGMGLGLWLSKHIIERHQGKISYQTSEMGGAEFVIRIPLELV